MPVRPAALANGLVGVRTTRETYEFLDRLKKYHTKVRGLKLEVTGKRWIDLNADNDLELDATKIDALLKLLRETLGEGEASLGAASLVFANGADLQDWVAEVRTQIKAGEVEQSANLADAA